MAQSIGSASLFLGLNAENLTSGLDKLKSQTQGSFDSIKKLATDFTSGIGGSLSGGISSLASSVSGLLSSGLQSGLAIALPGVGAAVGAFAATMLQPLFSAIANLPSLIRATFSRVADIVKSAKALGFKPAEFQSLSFAFGGTEALTASVRKFEVTLQHAKEGNIEALASFRHLGITANQVANLNSAAGWRLIVERLGAITDESARTSAAVAIFGRNAFEVLAALGKGGDELEKLQAKMIEFGQQLSDPDLLKLKNADKSFKILGGSIEGIVNMAAVGFAQLVTDLNGWVADIISRFRPMIEFMSDSFAGVWELASPIVDMLVAGFLAWMDLLNIGFAALSAIIKPIFSVVAAVFAVVMAPIKVFFEFLSAIFMKISKLIKDISAGVAEADFLGIISALNAVASTLGTIVTKLKEAGSWLAKQAKSWSTWAWEGVFGKSEKKETKPDVAGLSAMNALIREGTQAMEAFNASQARVVALNAWQAQADAIRRMGLALGLTTAEINSMAVMQNPLLGHWLATAEAQRQSNATMTLGTHATQSQIEAMMRLGQTYQTNQQAAQLYHMAVAGATQQQLNAQIALNNATNAATYANTLATQGAQLTEQFLTPLEQMTNRMAQLNALVRAGTISWQTYKLAAQAANAAFQSASGTDKIKFSAADDASALTAIFTNQMQGTIQSTDVSGLMLTQIEATGTGNAYLNSAVGLLNNIWNTILHPAGTPTGVA